MKYLFLFICTLLLVSCGPTVDIDYDEQIEFSKYTTYNFFPTLASGLNGLDENRVITAVDSVLQERGFIKSEKPQLFINFYANEIVSNSRNTIGIGIGGGGNVGVGVSGGIPIGGREINQEFTLDFIDVAKDDLVWQAIIDASYKERANPQQKEAYYVAIMEKALKRYPPKQ